MARCVLTALMLVLIAGCASQRATVSTAGQAAGGGVSVSQPDTDATAQSGLLNLVADLRAALDAYTAIAQKNQQAGRDIVMETHGDKWLTRGLAASWLLYPMVWRPMRLWRRRRKARNRRSQR